MARRSRFRDVSSVGRSDVVPYRRGEDPAERHARRLYTNLKFQEEVRAWAQRHGIVLKIKNEGHHWIFEYRNRVAEWWPSSAKLVIDRAYSKGIHVHDYKQLIKYLTKEWNLNVERGYAQQRHQL